MKMWKSSKSWLTAEGWQDPSVQAGGSACRDQTFLCQRGTAPHTLGLLLHSQYIDMANLGLNSGSHGSQDLNSAQELTREAARLERTDRRSCSCPAGTVRQWVPADLLPFLRSTRAF